jgi:hypothetical protein
MQQVETTSNRQYPVSNQGRRAPEVKPHAIPCHPICLSSGPSEPAPLTGYLGMFILHDVCHFINSVGANLETLRVRARSLPKCHFVLEEFRLQHRHRIGSIYLSPDTLLYRHRRFHKTSADQRPIAQWI